MHFFFFPLIIYNECAFVLGSGTPSITKGERSLIHTYLPTHTHRGIFPRCTCIFVSYTYPRVKRGERYLSRLLSSCPKLTQDLYYMYVRPLLQDHTLSTCYVIPCVLIQYYFFKTRTVRFANLLWFYQNS